MKYLFLVTLLFFTGCSFYKINEESFDTSYVSKSYLKKDMGYDWVSVRLKEYDENYIRVIIRSRNDIKKPTCTFDELAYKQNKNQFIAYKFNKQILFTLSNDKLYITSNKDENILKYFCSGGGSLQGEYLKYNKPLDNTQIDKIEYINSLNYNNINFLVEVKNKKLKLTTLGLKYSKEPFYHNLEEEVYFSEVADLNSDNSPEIYIYAKDKQKTKVIAYSVNNMLSLSEIYLEPIKLEELKDEVRVVENRLIRKVYLKNGKIKQIEYKLVPGEATWQLKIQKIMQY